MSKSVCVCVEERNVPDVEKSRVCVCVCASNPCAYVDVRLFVVPLLPAFFRTVRFFCGS